LSLDVRTQSRGPGLFSGLIRPGVEWIALPADQVDTLIRARPGLATWERLEDPAVPGVVILVRDDASAERTRGSLGGADR